MSIEKCKNGSSEKSIYIPFLLTISLLIVYLFLPYFQWLFESWAGNVSGSFGYLVPFVSLWALYSKSKEIISSPYIPSKSGWPVFFAGVILALFFRWNNQAILACVALPAFLYGLCLIFLGSKKSRYFIFPIFFLMFLYPWGNLLDAAAGFQLRRFTVYVSYILFRALGMENAGISGTLLYTGRFLVDIAPACSGLTMMNVLLFMAAIGGYLYKGKKGRGLIIFFSVIPLSVILNTIRVSVTGLTGHFYGEEAAMGYYHQLSGMMLFGLAVIFLYWESCLLKRIDG